jgi:hypothetical protein
MVNCPQKGHYMAKRTIKAQGKASEVNGEGNEKDDGTSSTLADIATWTSQDDNPKIAGLVKGANSRKN